jgi:putative Mg2+ transporter-C (MgtC) family protein
MTPLAVALFFDVWEPSHLGRAILRLFVAAVLGGLLGLERQQEGKAAGLRTHMLVAMGAALFGLLVLETASDPPTEEQITHLSRVIEGVVTGIGFLGAGTILKLSEQREIKGLTTAATIWLTAAVGVSVGAGWVVPALVATGLAVVVLFIMNPVEAWVKRVFPPRRPRE